MSVKKKVFVVFSSASGHVNPVCGLVYELCQQPEIECYFYGIEDHRAAIEKTGATFRLYIDRNIADTQLPQVTERHKDFIFSRFMNCMIDSSYKVLPELIRDAETDKPDLIIVDPGFITSKYLVDILKKRGLIVKCVEFFPHFVMTQTMLDSVSGLMPKNVRMFLSIIYILLRQIWLGWTFGIFYNPTDLLVGKKEHLKVVAIFPELHPRLEDYDDTYKFVGNCVSEQTRKTKTSNDDSELDSILNMFPDKSGQIKLIYMSLGTVFNHNLFVYEAVIQALGEFDQNPNRKELDSSKLVMIISLGESGFRALKEKIAKNELALPKNVLLRARVPQLDVLQKADLFITHCGMNSASETIKYGVPIVAIPIDGDQPLVAVRMCDQLSLGIRLDPLKLHADQTAEAINQVLTDTKFKKNMLEFSRVSGKYNGKQEGAKLIIEFLNKN